METGKGKAENGQTEGGSTSYSHKWTDGFGNAFPAAVLNENNLSGRALRFLFAGEVEIFRAKADQRTD